MEVCKSQLPASKSRLEVYSNASSDPVCQRVTEYCRNGWPNKKKLHTLGR